MFSRKKLPCCWFSSVPKNIAMGNLPPHVRIPGGRGVQLYTGSRLPNILPSSDTRKPGGRGVQLKLSVS